MMVLVYSTEHLMVRFEERQLCGCQHLDAPSWPTGCVLAYLLIVLLLSKDNPDIKCRDRFVLDTLLYYIV